MLSEKCTHISDMQRDQANGLARRRGRCPSSARSRFRNCRACEMRDNSATIRLAGEAIGAKRAQADELVQFA